MDPSAPIGVFDSGIGGLTVAHGLVNRLPNEQIIYFGDTAHLPYGDKSADAIRYYSLKIVKFLLEQGCKVIIIACNSASSTAAKVIHEFFGSQALFVDVVAPLVTKISSKPYKKVGLIATKATVGSGVYQAQLKELRPELDIFALAAPLLVPMIEEGFHEDRISHAIIETYLSNPGFSNIDALMLACTHYPLIREEIESYFKGTVDVFDSIEAVVNEVVTLLEENWALNSEPVRPHSFYVSDFTPSFEATTRRFYPGEIHLRHCPIW